jgi:hypothetical protein
MSGKELIALVLIGSALTACSEPKQLYIVHNTIIGVDAVVNSDRSAGHLTIGYDRNFLALVPRSVPAQAASGSGQPDNDAKARDAMAALVCSELEVDGIFLTAYNEKLATGAAANKAAEQIRDNPNRTSIFDCADRK